MRAPRLLAIGTAVVAMLCAQAVAGATTAPAPKPNVTFRGVVVLGAASLADVFRTMAPSARYSFAGSDQLAFQIEQGAIADVFASASPKYPAGLFTKGLVERPVRFASNRLVVIVPKANPAGIRSISDLARPGVTLVIGDASVPVGAYTRTVLGRLGLDEALSSVVSNEPDVRGIVAKVALGEADAGIAYATDLVGQRGTLTSIAIDPRAQPTVAYSVAVVRSGRSRAKGRAFIAYLRSNAGRAHLARFGFVPA